MARYFFHSVDGTLEIDDEGTELPTLSAAQVEAARLAGALLRDEPGKLWDQGSWRVEVTDSVGVLQFTVVSIAVDANLRRPKNAAAND